MRTGNPVLDKKSYINLVFAEDIIETISTEIYNQFNSISRITSSVDINISSIYDFLNSKNNTSNNDNKKLKKIDSLYLDEYSSVFTIASDFQCSLIFIFFLLIFK